MYSKVFKIMLTVECVLLFIQFWLGMSVNLFVIVPLSSAFSFSSYSGGYEVFAHLVNGVLVLAISGLILSYGFRLESRFISALSSLAVVFTVIAAATGATFALEGQNNSLSMAMAMSFLIIYTVYFSEFYLVGRISGVSSLAG